MHDNIYSIINTFLVTNLMILSFMYISYIALQRYIMLKMQSFLVAMINLSTGDSVGDSSRGGWWR